MDVNVELNEDWCGMKADGSKRADAAFASIGFVLVETKIICVLRKI